MKILIHFILLFLISCMSYKSNLTNIGILKSDYQLIWSEEFNESRLDTNKWNIEIRDEKEKLISLCRLTVMIIKKASKK